MKTKELSWKVSQEVKNGQFQKDVAYGSTENKDNSDKSSFIWMMEIKHHLVLVEERREKWFFG